MKNRLRQVQPVLMSRDVRRSIDFYRKLGFDLVFCDDPGAERYAGVRRDDVELHLQWHDADEWEYPVDRPTYRFPVQQVDALHTEMEAADTGTSLTAVWDTAWGTREFHLLDPDGNGLQFYRDLPINDANTETTPNGTDAP
ncbi:glyoxalase/bleomycin resistance/extradiol dioxygenase family protein [Roseiconus nitratireducens]|uniref:Glyoxalase/bleomycin resistance/extradiol dioxygenase family protein n=1 Tax=Roseiconus nitratireducens TaxID=2605748 RepID=A0A5M6DA60_9BACT|nr:VOC family protein [Roseiconus nitratireducens]KAA5544437.1 glyoxalase/bleomycin resistance/extradiol dioxygenase family protein [Roseiconus nitratireducens]